MVGDTRGLELTRVQTDVSLFSFLIVTVSFFLGFLLTNYDSFNEAVKVPVSYLLLSLFSLIYATLTLANSSVVLISGNKRKFDRHMLLAYAISEYLGIYPLIFGVPMTVGVLTQDVYLRSFSLVLSVAGLCYYHFAHVSIIEMHLPPYYRHVGWILSVLLCGLVVSQIFSIYLMLLSLVTLFFFIAVTVVAIRTNRAATD